MGGETICTQWVVQVAMEDQFHVIFQINISEKLRQYDNMQRK